MVDRDCGVRPQTTLETLGKLKPAFKKGGATTAGNSSQVTDGAAVSLLARRSHAKKLGLPIKEESLDSKPLVSQSTTWVSDQPSPSQPFLSSAVSKSKTSIAGK